MIESINNFIIRGKKIEEESSLNREKSSRAGIIDLTGDMPKSMHEWVNDIEIFSFRMLKNHPLKFKLDSAISQSKNNQKDFDKIMGLLSSLSNDPELVKGNYILTQKVA